jgi:non-ribosomal peptide synthetase component F
MKSMRLFFQEMAQRHAAAIYIVYENERYTLGETFGHATRAASIFRDVYGVHKGDRVAIVIRNYPQVRTSDPSPGDAKVRNENNSLMSLPINGSHQPPT